MVLLRSFIPIGYLNSNNHNNLKERKKERKKESQIKCDPIAQTNGHVLLGLNWIGF